MDEFIEPNDATCFRQAENDGPVIDELKRVASAGATSAEASVVSDAHGRSTVQGGEVHGKAAPMDLHRGNKMVTAREGVVEPHGDAGARREFERAAMRRDSRTVCIATSEFRNDVAAVRQ